MFDAASHNNAIVRSPIHANLILLRMQEEAQMERDAQDAAVAADEGRW